MSARRILVTGGAGFIGSNVLTRLAEQENISLVCCDRLRAAPLGKWRNIRELALDDLVAPEDLFTWLDAEGAGLDAIIHLGAISATTETDVDKIVAVNFRLSRDLWRWCVEAGVRFVYASSAAVYGDGAHGFEDDPSREHLAALRPLNAYGWSKLLFDRWALTQAGRGAAPPSWAGLRYFNVYGPREDHKGAMRSVIAKIWPDVAAGRAVSLFRSHRAGVADGDQARDFLWVGDAADATVWAAGAYGVAGVFNVGSGRARTFNDLAAAVFAAAGRAPLIDYVPTPPEIRRHYQYFTEAPLARIRAAGWRVEPTVLEEGVRRYVAEHLARETPVEDGEA